MNESILKDRFFRFSWAVYQLTKEFPKEPVYSVVTNQILKSSSSSGANYHAACRGKSTPDFTNKLRIVEEELDETIYWFKYISGIDDRWQKRTELLNREGNELLAIIIASKKTILSKGYLRS
jgi:four helix bundle protein